MPWRCYGLKSRQRRLRETGLLTSAEMAAMLHTSPTMIWYWRCHGVLNGEAYGKNKFLYHPPGPELLNMRQVKQAHNEVQYEM